MAVSASWRQKDPPPLLLPWNKTSCSKLRAGRVRVSLGKATRWSQAQVKPTASPLPPSLALGQRGGRIPTGLFGVTSPKEQFPFQARVPEGFLLHVKGGCRERGFGDNSFLCGAESEPEAEEGWGIAANAVRPKRHGCVADARGSPSGSATPVFSPTPINASLQWVIYSRKGIAETPVKRAEHLYKGLNGLWHRYTISPSGQISAHEENWRRDLGNGMRSSKKEKKVSGEN
ncbi:UNVERIFIED_CONTAM: hypothetical protein K2H54_018197 [Gekko kuhli]